MYHIGTISKYLTENTEDEISNFSYLVAVSGGIDSMFLFECMFELSKKHNFKLGVAHFNYNTSSSSSLSMELCKKIVSQYGLPLYIRSSNISRKDNFEHTARLMRYNFFTNIVNHEKYDFVVTGHNYNDLIETLYMQNDKDDYSLIPFSNRRVLRPILSLKREEIEKDVNEHGVDFVYDLTNNDNQFKRNKIRNLVLPKLSKNNDNHRRLLNDYNDKIERLNHFINKRESVDTENIDFNKENNIISINSMVAKSYDLYAFKMIIQSEIKKHFNIHVLKSKKFWKQFYKSINDDLTINKLSLCPKLDVYFSNNVIMISLSNHFELCKRILDDTKWLCSNFNITEYIVEENTNNHKTDKSFFILNKSQLEAGVYVRRWHYGDRIQLRNLGRIKVSDLFNSKSIPRLLRKKIPIVETNNTVVWIPRIAIAENNHSGKNLVKISHRGLFL